jgi:hypothetical protein
MAALPVGKQAAPGNDPTRCFAHRVYSVRRILWLIELPRLETFPGAACYQPIELPSYKAAPLQAFGSAHHAACLQPANPP